MANVAEEFEPPAWSCGNTPDMERRFLSEDDDHGDDDDHDHDHSDHRDHSDHHDHHDHHHDFDPLKTEEALTDLRRSLRGAEMCMGKRRRVEQQGAGYAYWVDMYIEIDRDLCARNGELATCDAGTIGPNTINYVNALFVGANTIYEVGVLLVCEN